MDIRSGTGSRLGLGRSRGVYVSERRPHILHKALVQVLQPGHFAISASWLLGNFVMLTEMQDPDRMLAGLQRLRDNGGLEGDDAGRFWFTEMACSDVDELVQDGSQMAIEQYQLVSQDRKTACRVFASLTHSLEKELAIINEKIYPKYLQHSITAIPDDILGNILEMTDSDPFDLGLVSRRFRDLVLRLPSLWTTIRSRVSPRGQELALTRSRDKTLDLILNMAYTPEANLDSLVPHWHRAGDLLLYFCGNDQEKVDKYLHPLNMPKLRHLALGYVERMGREMDVFYNTWNMPNLKELSLSDLVRFPLHGVSLTKLDIRLSSSDSWFLSDIFNLLVSSGSLEDLSISCTSIQWEDPEDSDNEQERIELKQLRTFQLTVYIDDNMTVEDDFQPFVGLLVLPRLQEMRVSLSVWDPEEEITTDFADVFSAPRVCYPQLRTLELKISFLGGNAANYNRLNLRPLMGVAPALRRFTFEAPRVLLYIKHLEDPSTHFPPLETICFRRCFSCDAHTFCEHHVKHIRREGCNRTYGR